MQRIALAAPAKNNATICEILAWVLMKSAFHGLRFAQLAQTWFAAGEL